MSSTQSVLFWIDVVIGLMAMAGFISGVIAHVALLNSFDPEKLSKKVGSEGSRNAQSLFAPIECFDEGDAWLWHIRDRGLKAFALSALLFTILYAVSVALNVPIAPPK